MDNYLTALLVTLKSINAADLLNSITLFFAGLPMAEAKTIVASGLTSFALIFAAEIGDKSQLVCMALAAKHRPTPVILGAISAFAVLNVLAVSFGAVIANWLPGYVTAAAVALLFGIFGIQAIRTSVDEDSDEDVTEKSGHSIFFGTFLLIALAEFGDKTQLAVVALSSTNSPIGVCLGATLALGCTSALGVLAGRKLLHKIPLELLHKIGGLLFLALSVIAGINAYQRYFSL